MLPTTIYNVTLPANGVLRLPYQGEYFKILACDGLVKVRADWGTLDALTAGQGLEKSRFNYLEFTDRSGGNNNVRFLVGDRNFIDGLSGAISISSAKVPQSGNFLASPRTVTNASTQLLPGNPARQYLAIQNQDGTGSLYLQFGAAATTAEGIKISPGGTFELVGIAPTTRVCAIGDIANNNNVRVLEG